MTIPGTIRHRSRSLSFGRLKFFTSTSAMECQQPSEVFSLVYFFFSLPLKKKKKKEKRKRGDIYLNGAQIVKKNACQ